ncbi:hypothetical protein JCM10020v2_000869 [Rhodotorula toruloides]
MEASVEAHGREVRALDDAGGLATYSDGSLLDGRAGASAVVRFGAGEDELWGKKARTMATLFIDNQSVVRSPFDPSPTAGQYARLALRTLALALERDHPTTQLTLQWLAGHSAVPGNKLADEEAKRAAEVGDDEVGKSKRGLASGRGGRRRGPKLFRPDRSSGSSSSADESGWEEDEEERATRLEGEVARLGRLDSSTLTGPDGLVKGGILLPKSLSLLKQAHRAALFAEWTRRWSLSSSPGAGLRAVNARPPGPPFVRALHSLDRTHSTLLARLRLDFNDLGSSKARMGLGLDSASAAMRWRPASTTSSNARSIRTSASSSGLEIGSSDFKMDKIFSPSPAASGGSPL